MTVRYLANIQAHEAAPALVRLLRSRDRDVRIATIAALEKLDEKGAVDDLATVARSDSLGVVRAWALKALMTLDAPVSYGIAQELWRDPDIQVRFNVVEAFSRYGGEPEYQRLQEASREEERIVPRLFYFLKSRRMRKRLKRQR